MNLRERFVSWFRVFAGALVWIVPTFALAIWLVPTVASFLKIIYMPQSIRFFIGVGVGIISIPVFLSFSYVVLYSKINPFNLKVRYNQTPAKYILQIIASILVSFSAVGFIWTYSLWYWAFNWFFAIGVGCFVYMLIDSFVIYGAYSSATDTNEPSVKMVEARGGWGKTLVYSFETMKGFFGYQNKTETTNTFFENCVSFLSKKLKDYTTPQLPEKQTNDIPELQKENIDFTESENRNYQTEGWKDDSFPFSNDKKDFDDLT